ncbi:hypothetical protein CHUAL_007987 [Chamberlinius hualienensis]
MECLLSWLSISSSAILSIYGITLLTTLILATFGKSLGIRRVYVSLLLKLFAYGRVKIEKAHRRKYSLDKDAAEALSVFAVNSVITREGVKLIPEPVVHKDHYDEEEGKNVNENPFQIDIMLELTKAGVESIIDDEVTKRFAAEELVSWNLLTRTNKGYQFISLRLSIFWFLGFLFRYLILLPIRLLLLGFGVMTLVTSMAFIGYIPSNRLRKILNRRFSLISFRIFSRVFSAIIMYHDRQNMAKGGGICVANHTSPIDVVILACDNCYALIGQSHGGFLGVLQRGLARASSHIWFERSESKDRDAVTRRLREHVEDIDKNPILIFPEGTCINNTSVMMFKKGSFEVGSTIYPVAIKYDPKFGDPFWNSSTQSYFQYLLMMMTSWTIVCDVWYLPPMIKQEGEDAVQFANRVKAEIARRGGLVDLTWDGQLKRSKVKQQWKENQQAVISKRINVE